MTGRPPIACTICGERRMPPSAIAEYAVAICIGVTSSPWPIGRLPIDEPEYWDGDSVTPGSSPGRPTPVGAPKPKLCTQWLNVSGPSSLAIVIAPTLLERARICPAVSVSSGCSVSSWIVFSATWIWYCPRAS